MKKNIKSHYLYQISFWIILSLIITIRICLWIIYFRNSQSSLWCGQNGHGMAIQDISFTGTVTTIKSSYKYTLQTQYWFIQTTIFTQPLYKIGDNFLLEGSFECVVASYKEATAFSYPLYQFTHTIIWTLKPTKVELIKNIPYNNIEHSAPSKLTLSILSTSSKIPPSLTTFSSKYQWIPAWVLYGVVDNIDPIVYQQFIDSWLVYLIAASWWNISLLVWALALLCITLSMRYKRYIRILATILYTYILRSNIALIRACFWYIITLVTSITGRVISNKQLLIRVTIWCIIYDPYILISSWWFILSIAGVRGILFTPRSLQQHRILRYIAPTVRVFFALLWPLFVLTQRINLITPFVSLPAQLSTVVISYISLIIVCVWDHIPWLSDILYWNIKWLIYGAKFASDHGVYISLKDILYSYLLWWIIWAIIYVAYKADLARYFMQTKNLKTKK